jgi:membrane protein involved in colicin uptake
MSVSFYDQNADSFIEQTADVDMSNLYARFCRLLPDGGSILDAGSGSGRDALCSATIKVRIQRQSG